MDGDGPDAGGAAACCCWTVLDDGSYRAVTADPASKGLESVYRSYYGNRT
jgi:hypothetical protein